MSALSHVTPAFHPGYRRGAIGDPAAELAVWGQLGQAGDALSLAVLALEGAHADDARSEKRARAARAREHLVEAVMALSRARVHVSGIRTYAVPAVMAIQPDPDHELARLHQLSTRLLWQNHAYLPARAQGTPLSPEEELQLDRVVRDLRRHARLERAVKTGWLVGGLALAGLTPVLGLGAAAAGLLCAIVSVAWGR